MRNVCRSYKKTIFACGGIFKMATEKDLLEAVKENLERTGDLQKLKAEVRANIIKILDPNPTQVNKPEAPEETLLILGLISEFLEWHGYTYSAQFLFEESGTSKMPCRDLLFEDLSINSFPGKEKLPLLYTLVSMIKNMKKTES